MVISIHALREEGDLYAAMSTIAVLYFYPRPPRGGRQPSVAKFEANLLISIHALREEGDQPHRLRAGKGGISIHALREEGDLRDCGVVGALSVISIHALREEGDAQLSGNNREGMQFLSTPSARRAT